MAAARSTPRRARATHRSLNEATQSARCLLARGLFVPCVRLPSYSAYVGVKP